MSVIVIRLVHTTAAFVIGSKCMLIFYKPFNQPVPDKKTTFKNKVGYIREKAVR